LFLIRNNLNYTVVSLEKECSTILSQLFCMALSQAF
jgi:hypothetical protein